MGLRDYFKKRDFQKTPEPESASPHSGNKKLSFVVQEHHASHLHYDFRLELDGVLKSWAVPKGPSLDPHEHHLAIHTEDHPYEYRKFEGVIPEGNYGAGNVIIWDQGWYKARKGDPSDSQKTIRAELKKGHTTFILHGKKLKGEFALIQMHNDESGKSWLLVKKGDEFAKDSDVTKQDQSVKSNRKIDDLGASGKIPDLSSYPKKAAPWRVKPMLCTLIEEPFTKKDWLFEIKWDGYRAIASKKGSSVELYSRNQNDFYSKYPAVAEAIHSLKHDVILDGEIVVTDKDGKSHFEWLQNWHQNQNGNLGYYIFDILWCDGRDLRTMPLIERKKILKTLLPKSNILHYSDHIEAEGQKMFAQIRTRGLEGIVAKNSQSPYQEEVRGNDWLKIKTHLRQEVVIGGYTEPRGGRKYLGSLIVGVYDKNQLIYTGHSGGGIPDEQRRLLSERLAKLERKNSPFKTEPKPNAPVHWVKPELICEMSFSEWTSDGLMRHPQFKGMRADKKPALVKREKPKSITPAEPTNPSGLPFDPTHLDKIFFPRHKYTKQDMLNYYRSIADYILPYLKDRPCSMNRMPSGITGESFYQKNNEHLPVWVPSTDIFSKSNNENLHWIVGGELDTLLYMVQLGCVEINPWNSRVGKLKNPDWIVIDLDPEGVSFKAVIETALAVRQVCDEWRVPTYPKTSGKTGLHIYIPMGALYTYDQAKDFAHLIALEVNKRLPKITSVERLPQKRNHRVYLDFLQNRAGQTLAAPYSLRPTPEATVSTPLHWDEVNSKLDPKNYHIKNTLKRLNRTGDLWKPVLGKPINLSKILRALD